MHYIKVLKQEIVHTKSYAPVSDSEQSIVQKHIDKCKQLNTDIKITQQKLPTMYWMPKLHKSPYKERFIANSTSCTTTNLSILLTSCFTKIKEHVERYADKTFQNSGLNLFWSIKNSNEILDKIQSRRNLASSISTYDFSTLYTTLPHNLIKDKLTKLIEKTFARENKPILACNASRAFFTDEPMSHYTNWTCSEVCTALHYLLDNIFVRYGDTVYRQIIGIPMGTNCAPLIADLFLYCYESNFMLSLKRDSQADVIAAFNNTSRYLDDILNLDNPFFDSMYTSIYPKELKLNKASSSDTSAAFLDLDLSIENGVIHSKIYDKRDDFNFKIVNFPHLDGDVPKATSYGVYISQLIRFARACSSVADFHERNLLLTKKLLNQGYRYHKLRKTFSKFYYRNLSLISKYKLSLKALLTRGISHPEFYGDVVYKLRKIIGHDHFQTLFPKRIKHFRKKGYDPTILQRTACLVVDPFTVGNHAFLFNCALTGNA